MKIKIFTYSLVVFVLLIWVSFTTWEMLKYKNKYLDITDKQRWENTLGSNGVYDDNLIVFFGDSQIDRWAMATSFGSLPIKNKGISGDWALKSLKRLDADVLNLNPSIMVLLIGINDLGNGQSTDEIVNNIEKILHRAQDKTIEIILCSLLPVRGKYLKDVSLEDILIINQNLKRISKEHNINFVDFHSELTDIEGKFSLGLTADGLHPNEKGYLKMSEILLPYIIKTIVKKS